MTRSTAFFRVTGFLVAFAGLGGCTALSALGTASQPLGIYELRAPEVPGTPGRSLPLEVVVELPSASGSLATDRILIRPSALQAMYLPGVRWADQTPELVQTLMLRTLLNTGRFRSVGRRPLGAGGDYAILTELTDFQAETQAGQETATVRLGMVSRLVREEDASVVAIRTFTSTVVSPTDEDADLIRAFSLASDRMLVDFANWVVTAAGSSS